MKDYKSTPEYKLGKKKGKKQASKKNPYNKFLAGGGLGLAGLLINSVMKDG